MRWPVRTALGLLLCSSVAAAEPVLLVDSPFDVSGVRQPTRIYEVDLDTGGLTLKADLGDTYTPVLGLAAASGTVLYGVGSDNGPDPGEQCFVCVLLRIVLDPQSTTPVSVTAVGRIGPDDPHGFTALGFRGNGELYGVSEENDHLYRIDPETAQAEDLGRLSVDAGGGCTTTVVDHTGGDLVFDALDRMWVWNNTPAFKGLWEVNPNNACATARSSCPSSRNMAGMVVEEQTSLAPSFRVASAQDDRLYRAFSGPCPVNGEPGSQLLRLNGVLFDHMRGDLDRPYCADDAACGDGDACTTDVCSPGGCQHAFISCDDGDPCTVDGCDPASGCTSTPHTGACDDGDPCTEADACSEGACAGTPVAVPEVPSLLVGETPGGTAELSWAAVPGAGVTYDLVGGLVSELRQLGGVGSAACLRSDIPGVVSEDLREGPAPDDAFYYLVRAAGACGVGTYGQGSSGQMRTPGADCP